MPRGIQDDPWPKVVGQVLAQGTVTVNGCPSPLGTVCKDSTCRIHFPNYPHTPEPEPEPEPINAKVKPRKKSAAARRLFG